MFIVHTCSDYINTAADTRSMRKQMPTAGGQININIMASNNIACIKQISSVQDAVVY